jgi:hypothetical protein
MAAAAACVIRPADGTEEPKTAGSQHRNEWLGAPAPTVTPGVNLKVVPADTRVHGEGSVMHDFRDSLNVDSTQGSWSAR